LAHHVEKVVCRFVDSILWRDHAGCHSGNSLNRGVDLIHSVRHAHHHEWSCFAARCRHHIAKMKFSVRNWAEYDAALRAPRPGRSSRQSWRNKKARDGSLPLDANRLHEIKHANAGHHQPRLGMPVRSVGFKTWRRKY